ncbi:hypothetical protein GCM10020358_64710 [Amorphoplanes nipponensis]|uniref:Uncharacterized protein n=1 Tax=Actinoplanes nipponensis TaxID=135950 RepID=A0A919JD82_9ACTN|nr:hypothetical protein [Actinoplanes nipponensis]GIE47245.1 hypothetical protein Ani05nite_07790 [Actinoplanes nipponensis]
MTAAPPAPTVRLRRSAGVPLPGARRLVRLELRRNAMLWLLPWAVALFGLVAHRTGAAAPPLWNVRAMSMQTGALAVFVPTVIGAAAWMGSREARLGLTDLLTGTARSRWARHLASWAATSCWALAAYLAGVTVLYAVVARQAAWGGPLWWPAAVGAATMPALSALGFAAGVLLPSRFTAPLAAVGVFVTLELSLQLIHGGRSPLQVLPVVAGPWELGTDAGVAVFHPYLPDLPVVQLMFLAGLTAALVAALGLPAGSAGPRSRRAAAAITAAGLLLAGTATALAGTGRLDEHGLIAIPALHSAAGDRPVPYTPVCSTTAIPVCLHPAYTAYLAALAARLAPVLSDVAGLTGAPVRLSQAATVYEQGPGNTVEIRMAAPRIGGTPPVLHFLLPVQLAGPTMTVDQAADAVRAEAGPALVATVIGDVTGPAQAAVTAALLGTAAPAADPATVAAARRFAALPPATRHAWLLEHLPALRAGRLPLARVP